MKMIDFESLDEIRNLCIEIKALHDYYGGCTNRIASFHKITSYKGGVESRLRRLKDIFSSNVKLSEMDVSILNAYVSISNAVDGSLDELFEASVDPVETIFVYCERVSQDSNAYDKTDMFDDF